VNGPHVDACPCSEPEGEEPTKTDTDDALMSTIEVAELRGVSGSAVCRAIKIERLPATKLSGQWWVTLRDAKAWVLGTRGPKKRGESDG